MIYRVSKTYKFSTEQDTTFVTRHVEGTDIGGPKPATERFSINILGGVVDRMEASKLLSLLEWALNDK